MGYKFNYLEMYEGRLQEIDKQLAMSVRKKSWTTKKELQEERKRVIGYIEELKLKEVK